MPLRTMVTNLILQVEAAAKCCVKILVAQVNLKVNARARTHWTLNHNLCCQTYETMKDELQRLCPLIHIHHVMCSGRVLGRSLRLVHS